MEDKINVAELLRDCPNGMPLDCAMWDNLYFNRVEDDMIYCYYELDGYRNSTIFCKDGCYSEHKLSKCVIFPKGKTTWEGFVPPVKFKDGDILAVDDTIYIYNGVEDTLNHFVYVIADSKGLFAVDSSTKKYSARFATDEEKERLFKSIEEHGYKWYADTKSIVKLFKPNFKVGDTIRNKTDRWLSERTIKSYVEGIGYFTTINDWVRITDQDNWELVPIKPIFKVGDIIKCKNGTSKLIVMCIKDDKYIVDDDMGGKCGMLCFSQQDKWELINEPKFKVGDKIKSKSLDIVNPIEIATVTPRIYTFTNGSFQRVEIIDKDYELVKEPKFKIGDKIKKKDGIDYRLRTIESINNNHYIIKTPDWFDNCYITDKLPFNCQDEYELIHSNKFDINNLKPFESRVLVRDTDHYEWEGAVFGRYDGNTFFTIGGVDWKYCIPYEGNEHLLGKTDDCDECYKIWEE